MNGTLQDAYVAKVRADGTGFIYCGYISVTAHRDPARDCEAEYDNCAERVDLADAA